MMNEFDKAGIERLRSIMHNGGEYWSRAFALDALNHIEHQAERIAELEANQAGMIVVLGEMINEAQLQNPFSDDSGMVLLYGAKIMLEKCESKDGNS